MKTWARWVQSQQDKEMRRRRKIIVQIICCNNYTLKWMSYEKSVEMMDDNLSTYSPDSSTDVIKDAAAFAAKLGWNANSIKNL